MADLDRIQQLVADTIEGFDDRPTSASLRRCLRIATLRGDVESLVWLEMEARDVTVDTEGRVISRRAELLTGLPVEKLKQLLDNVLTRYKTNRRVDSKTTLGLSIDQLESRVQHLRDQAAAMHLPQGMHPVDLAHRYDDTSKARMSLLSAAHDTEQVIHRVRGNLYDFLVVTEHHLNFGAVNAGIFDRTRRLVDQDLGLVAPEALEQFQIAYRRVTDGDPESLSHAVTSCRRILSTVADSVYPATGGVVVGADGVGRKMTAERYLNRLLQFVAERQGKHGSGEVVTHTLKALGERLSSLDGLGSKGVHAQVTPTEVDTCVIQTYLMLGEILRLHHSPTLAKES